jgi:hypothetical protein
MTILIWKLIKEFDKDSSLSQILFNMYTGKFINDGLQVTKQNNLVKDFILNTILFADDQVIVASAEDEL